MGRIRTRDNRSLTYPFFSDLNPNASRLQVSRFITLKINPESVVPFDGKQVYYESNPFHDVPVCNDSDMQCPS